MIEKVRIRNYKALLDVTVPLRPMHVLIGPNDSGKTSILEAVQAICRSTTQQDPFPGLWERCELVWKNRTDLAIELEASLRLTDRREATYQVRYAVSPATGELMPRRDGKIQGLADEEASRVFYSELCDAHYYRWVPRALALPVAPDLDRRYRMAASGFGLAAFLDDILGFDRQLFGRLESRFCGFFPQFTSIILRPEQGYLHEVASLAKEDSLLSPGKGIQFKTSEGQLIPATQASDGVLLVLAYLAVLHTPIEPPHVLLVEEPENGMHPKRLAEVLTILRELVGDGHRTQVVMTTHSPYVLDLFDPSEVTLCLKESDGSVSCHPLAESEIVREQMKLFTLGEIWTSESEDALAGKAAPTPRANQ